MKNKNQIPPSPFVENRRDNEIDTQIYVNYEDYSEWNTMNNVIIIGGRGSGKSTILNLFDYRTLWLNNKKIEYGNKYETLQGSHQHIIGVLFRCEETEVKLWNDWYKKASTNEENTKYELIFGAYLNFFFIEKIINAILEITEYGQQLFDEANLSDLIKDIYERTYMLDEKRPYLYDFSLKTLRKRIRDTHAKIRDRIINDISPIKITKEIYCLSANDGILSDICEYINKHVHFKDFNSEETKPISFFFLIDDIDRLNNWQQQVVNTFFTSKKQPCAFKATCTGYSFANVTVNDRSVGAVDRPTYILFDDSLIPNFSI